MSAVVQDLMRRALALHQAGEYVAAKKLYRDVVALDPNLGDAWNLLGLVAREEGDGAAAARHIERAIEISPDFADYHVNLAVVLQTLGQRDRAAEACRRAIALDPELPEAHYNLATTYLAQGRSDEALAGFREAVQFRADYPEANNNIGHILLERGDAAAALPYFERAAEERFAPALSNICGALSTLERHDAAIEAGRDAVAAAPEDPAAFYNLANAYNAAGDPDTAIELYETAVTLAPGHVDAWCNLGVAQLARNAPADALRALDRALAIDPDIPDANWNKAMVLLLVERYAEGWQLYEWRWRAVEWLERRSFDAPEWRGEPLDGRTILIHTEQGYGDTLQFVRLLTRVASAGGRIILACQPPLKRLLGALPAVAETIGYGEPVPPFDCHLPIMSLPLVLGLDQPPESRPYLMAPAPRKDRRLDGDQPRIGFVWRGSRINKRGMFRSSALADFAPLAALAGARFFSLQIDADAIEKAELARLNVTDLSGDLADFADTAEFVARLDLVVTIDTAMAHLAGGLEVPVWVLLSFAADWRWQLDRVDSPWYPAMRLYRQSGRGD